MKVKIIWSVLFRFKAFDYPSNIIKHFLSISKMLQGYIVKRY